MSILLMAAGGLCFLTGLMMYLSNHRSEMTATGQIQLEHVIQTAVADGTLTTKEKALIQQIAAENGSDPELAIQKAEKILKEHKGQAETEVIDYSRKNGLDFEKFIATRFDPKFFKITKWAGDKYAEGIYSKENLDPDIQLQISVGNRTAALAVECKWRRTAYKNEIQISGPEQLRRYKAFARQNKVPVFIALGLGGSGEQPQELYIIPLEALSSEKVFIGDIQAYRKDLEKRFFFDFESERLR